MLKLNDIESFKKNYTLFFIEDNSITSIVATWWEIEKVKEKNYLF